MQWGEHALKRRINFLYNQKIINFYLFVCLIKSFALCRDNMDPGGITRDEIGEIIPEYLTNIIQENQRRGNIFEF